MTDGEIRASYRQAKYPEEQIKILSQLTTKSIAEIKEICGLKVDKKDGRYWGWTDDDIEYLKANYHLPDREIGKVLNKNAQAVRNKRQKLGLPGCGEKARWTPAEIAFVINGYNYGMKQKDMAKYIGRSTECIAAKIHQLKVKKQL